MVEGEAILVYDKECPLCDSYCRLVRIRRDIGDLKIIDARDDSDILDEITRQGLDIDQGMVLKLDGVLYYGSDAINALALISSRSGFFNRVNFRIFKSPTVSALLYPVLRSCRNVLLKLLKKSKINNLGVDGNDRF